MQKLFHWLDNHGLMLLAGFLLVFIPLYPKLPLFDIIPGYIVRVRIEDFLILFTAAIWFFRALRGKEKLHPLMTKIFVAYIVVGLLSCLSAMFITKTVPLVDIHIAKLFLNYFRRIEYFSLFFIFFSAVKSIKQIKLLISLLIVSMICVAGYGFGQKYLYWPVYSTMNREFSKGMVLYLSEHARVPSTFGGHYDAAAYTMIVLTILLAVSWYATSKWLKWSSTIAFLAGFWLLILTASRTSFIAYLGAVSLLAFMSMFVKKWWWPIPRYLLVMVFSLVVMLSFGDLSERFAEVFGLKSFKEKFAQTLLSAKINKPSNGQAVSEVSLVTTPSDTPPSSEKPNNLPGGVYENIPLKIAETDAEGKYTGSYKVVSRTYSDNAYKYGLSAAIRLDTTWPLAIAGFQRNPLLGSGYSTLSKESVGHFTEAESTDNDFLRNLGETGILGVLFFYGAVITAAVIALRSVSRTQDVTMKGILVGYVAANIGLLSNGIYIDIFEASKVAEVFWALTGMVIALSTFPNNSQLAPIPESPLATVPATKKPIKKISKKKK